MHAVALGVLLSLGTLAAPVARPAADGAPKRKFLSASQILERMEASPVHYRIADADKLADVPASSWPELLWPLKVPPAAMPKVVRESGGTVRVEEWKVAPGLEKLSAEAEDLYDQKDFAGAAKKYREMLERDPGHYLIEAGLGDCALFSGDAKTALKRYEKARRANPDDYRLYFYRGNALMTLGKKNEALDSFVESLVLKPRNPFLLKQLTFHAERLGIAVQPELMVPRAFVRREGEDWVIYFDKKEPWWLAWGSCKALWKSDPEHRKDVTGSDQPGWSTSEELECLGALLAAYEGQVDKHSPDPALRTLSQVVEDGLASAFVIYEIGSRLDPQIVLKMDEAARKNLRRYIRRFVLDLPAK